MENKLAEKIERLETQLPRWEKWLYACYSAAFIMLAHGFVKAYENNLMYQALFFIEEKAGATNSPDFTQYFTDIYRAQFSPWGILLWLIVELVILASAAILAFHPAWRKVALAKRLDLIGGYLLAAWVTFLTLAAQDPYTIENTDYSTIVVGYLLILGLGYWWLRRKKDRAEEVFP